MSFRKLKYPRGSPAMDSQASAPPSSYGTMPNLRHLGYEDPVPVIIPRERLVFQHHLMDVPAPEFLKARGHIYWIRGMKKS